jgi:hypothetical protein
MRGCTTANGNGSSEMDNTADSEILVSAKYRILKHLTMILVKQVQRGYIIPLTFSLVESRQSSDQTSGSKLLE